MFALDDGVGMSTTDVARPAGFLGNLNSKYHRQAVTVFMVVVAATARLYAPFVRQLLGRETASPSEMGTAERIG